MTVDSFWEWSLTRYGCASTRSLLLSLQGAADLVIVEALFAAWLGCRQFEWQSSAVDRMRLATSDWVEKVILPLRMTRGQWKTEERLRKPREHLLQLEVQAEHHLAQLIWSAVMDSPATPVDVVKVSEQLTRNLMESNLAWLSPFYDRNNVRELKQLVALLSQPT